MDRAETIETGTLFSFPEKRISVFLTDDCKGNANFIVMLPEQYVNFYISNDVLSSFVKEEVDLKIISEDQKFVLVMNNGYKKNHLVALYSMEQDTMLLTFMLDKRVMKSFFELPTNFEDSDIEFS